MSDIFSPQKEDRYARVLCEAAVGDIIDKYAVYSFTVSIDSNRLEKIEQVMEKTFSLSLGALPAEEDGESVFGKDYDSYYGLHSRVQELNERFEKNRSPLHPDDMSHLMRNMEFYRKKTSGNCSPEFFIPMGWDAELGDDFRPYTLEQIQFLFPKEIFGPQAEWNTILPDWYIHGVRDEYFSMEDIYMYESWKRLTEQQIYPPIYAGYVFAYVCELFNQRFSFRTEMEDRSEVVRKVIRLYSHYASCFGKDAQNLAEMLILYIQSYRLPYSLLIDMMLCPGLFSLNEGRNDYFAFDILARTDASWLTSDILFEISNHNWRKGALYKRQPQFLDEMIKQSVQEVALRYEALFGHSLFEDAESGEQDFQKLAFLNPLFPCQRHDFDSGYYYSSDMKPFILRPTSLSERPLLGEVCRQIEYELRLLTKTSRIKESNSLVMDLKKIIHDVTLELYQKKTASPAQKTEEKKKPFVLDFDAISKLRDESDQVRQALKVEEADSSQPNPQNPQQESAAQTKTELEEKAEDRERIQATPKAQTETEKQTKTEEQAETEEQTKPEAAGKTEKQPEANSNSALAEKQEPARAASSARDSLLQEYVQLLDEQHKDILRALLVSADVMETLEEQAASLFTMPDFLADELNEPFMQTVNDVLLDAYSQPASINEQYKEDLKALLEQ